MDNSHIEASSENDRHKSKSQRQPKLGNSKTESCQDYATVVELSSEDDDKELVSLAEGNGLENHSFQTSSNLRKRKMVVDDDSGMGCNQESLHDAQEEDLEKMLELFSPPPSQTKILRRISQKRGEQIPSEAMDNYTQTLNHSDRRTRAVRNVASKKFMACEPDNKSESDSGSGSLKEFIVDENESSVSSEPDYEISPLRQKLRRRRPSKPTEVTLNDEKEEKEEAIFHIQGKGGVRRKLVIEDEPVQSENNTKPVVMGDDDIESLIAEFKPATSKRELRKRSSTNYLEDGSSLRRSSRRMEVRPLSISDDAVKGLNHTEVDNLLKEEEESESESEGGSLDDFITNESEEEGASDAQEDESVEGSQYSSEEPNREVDKAYKFEFQGDLQAALARDDALCMRAVAALYRQQTDEEIATKTARTTNRRGFDQCEARRASKLADTILFGDPLGTVKLQPHHLAYADRQFCRRVAMKHAAQLFNILQNEEDPHFPNG